MIQTKGRDLSRPLDCRKKPAGFSDKLLQSAARIIGPPIGDQFHTCSLRCVFCQVHAPAENGLNFICRQWRQTLRGFFDKLKGGTNPALILLLFFSFPIDLSVSTVYTISIQLIQR